MKKYIGYSNSFNKASTVIALSLILGTVTYAWTGPTDTAPNGNVPAPINVGTALQEKLGSLNIFGDLSIGQVSNPTASLTIRGKGYSEQTLASDGGATLVTKDYVDEKVGNINLPPCDMGASLVSGGNGSWICVAPGLREFKNPGTSSFTIPSGVYSVNVELIGGGGGGGGSVTNNFTATRLSGGGGFASSLQTKTSIQVSPGQVLNVIVGSGGSGGGGGSHPHEARDGDTGGSSSVSFSGGASIVNSSGGTGGPHAARDADYNPINYNMTGANSVLGSGGQYEQIGGIGAGGGGGYQGNDPVDWGGPGAAGGPGYVKIYW